MNAIPTLYLSKDYKILHKAPKQHFDEVLTRSDGDWEAVHRIDFETSGALLFAIPELVQETRKLFQTPFKVEKIYLAGASAELRSRRVQVEGFIGSRYRSSKKVHFFDDEKSVPRGWHSLQEASMDIEESSADITPGVFSGKLYEVKLYTGARHQIRAYFAAKKATIVGDPVYGTEGARLELHAWKLGFDHPRTGERVAATAPL